MATGSDNSDNEVLATVGTGARAIEIKRYDVVQVNREMEGEPVWEDYASIKNRDDAAHAMSLFRRGDGCYRIVRKGLDARVVLT